MDETETIARHDKAVRRLKLAAVARVAVNTERVAAIRHAYRIGIPQTRIATLCELTQPRISQIIGEGTEYLT